MKKFLKNGKQISNTNRYLPERVLENIIFTLSGIDERLKNTIQTLAIRFYDEYIIPKKIKVGKYVKTGKRI